MRILMVLDHPYPSDLRVENEARTLLAAGHEVALLQVAPDTRPAESVEDGVRVFRDRIPKKLGTTMRGLAGVTPLFDRYLARAIPDVYARWPFDALHVHDLYLVGGGLRAGARLGVPVVADLHENWVEALQHYAWSTRLPGRLVVHIPTWERVERESVRWADRLVVPIEEAAERYTALGVDPARIAVVPNTVDLTSFDAYPLEPEIVERTKSAFTVLYTGHIDAHRGLETVVEGWPAILAGLAEARLVIVGDGKTVPELKARVTELGLDASVRFEGRVPQPHIKSYIAGADVSLVPHLKTPHTDNTIPHKIFHGMRLGVPVVVSDCAPLERIVEAERCGAVFASGDPAAFAEAVLRVARDPDRAAMGERGRDAVLARYNWDATAAPLVATYADLERQRGTPLAGSLP